MREAVRVLIVGSGIGGLAIAVALRKLGMEASIWERAAELREVGAGLLLTANATSVLRKLEVFEAASSRGRLMQRWEILDQSARVLQAFDFSQASASLSITRSSIQQLLRECLPVDAISLNHELAEMCEDANGSIRLRSAHGKQAEADLVIGADGGRSTVGRTWMQRDGPKSLGYVGWRALVRAVPDGWQRGRITESWAAGCRFGIAPVNDQYSYWYATENVPSGWDLPPQRWKAHLLTRFQRWHEPVLDLIDATPAEAIHLARIEEARSLKFRGNGGVTLLGDAAHLMSPNLGQGAAMALEDAWVLANCISCRGVCAEALREYEWLRTNRVRFVVWLSRQIGRLIQLEQPLLWRGRNLGLACTPNRIGQLALQPVFAFRA